MVVSCQEIVSRRNRWLTSSKWLWNDRPCRKASLPTDSYRYLQRPWGQMQQSAGTPRFAVAVWLFLVQVCDFLGLVLSFPIQPVNVDCLLSMGFNISCDLRFSTTTGLDDVPSRANVLWGYPAECHALSTCYGLLREGLRKSLILCCFVNDIEGTKPAVLFTPWYYCTSCSMNWYVGLQLQWLNISKLASTAKHEPFIHCKCYK